MRDRASRTALLIAAAYTLLALVASTTVDFTDDEGMLAYQASRAFWGAPAATFFFLKFRPVGALIGAPGAAFGWRAFLLWHDLLGGASVLLLLRAIFVYAKTPLTAIAAALVVVTSPVLFISTLAGQSNVEGIGLFALALNLILAEKTAAAAFTLSVLPFVRFEYAPWSLGLGLYLLHAQPVRPLFRGALPFPILFLLAGAVYHQDALWMIHFTPSLPTAEATSQQFDAIVPTASYVSSSLLLFSVVSPAWPLAGTFSLQKLDDLGKALLGTLVVVFLMIYVFPFLRVFKFDHTPRYWLVLLPAFALVLARQGFERPGSTAMFVLAGLAGIGMLLGLEIEDHGIGATIAAAFSMPLVVTFAGRRGPRAAAVAGAISAVALAGLGFRHEPRMRQPLDISLPKNGLEDVVRWIGDHRGELAPGAIYSDAHQLDALLAARGLASVGPVRFLVPYDIEYELYHLADKKNGQYAEMIGALEAGALYGKPLWTCELAATTRFPGVVFITTNDYRLGLSFPAGYWDRVSETIATFGVFTVRRAIAEPAPPAGPEQEVHLGDPAVTAPCVPEVRAVRARHTGAVSSGPGSG
ncbi:MAG: hypothetical protein U0359_33460 [Byssovorax sp.]